MLSSNDKNKCPSGLRSKPVVKMTTLYRRVKQDGNKACSNNDNTEYLQSLQRRTGLHRHNDILHHYTFKVAPIVKVQYAMYDANILYLDATSYTFQHAKGLTDFKIVCFTPHATWDIEVARSTNNLILADALMCAMSRMKCLHTHPIMQVGLK